MMRNLRLCLVLPILLFNEATAAISPLASRGYAVLPDPRRVGLRAGDFRFGPAWSVQRNGVGANDIAVTSLIEGLKARFHLPGPGGGAGAIQITLATAAGAVAILGECVNRVRMARSQYAQADNAPVDNQT